MIGILGPFKSEMTTQGAFTSKYFKNIHNSYTLFELNDKGEEIHLLPKKTSLKSRLKCDDPLFEDFVSMLLKQDPKER